MLAAGPTGRAYLIGLCLVLLVLLVTLACRYTAQPVVPLEVDYGTPTAPPAGTIPRAVP